MKRKHLLGLARDVMTILVKLAMLIHIVLKIVSEVTNYYAKSLQPKISHKGRTSDLCTV